MCKRVERKNCGIWRYFTARIQTLIWSHKCHPIEIERRHNIKRVANVWKLYTINSRCSEKRNVENTVHKKKRNGSKKEVQHPSQKYVDHVHRIKWKLVCIFSCNIFQYKLEQYTLYIGYVEKKIDNETVIMHHHRKQLRAIYWPLNCNEIYKWCERT